MAKPFSPLAAVLVAGLIALADLVTKAAIVEHLAYGQQIELLPLLNIVHVISFARFPVVLVKHSLQPQDTIPWSSLCPLRRGETHPRCVTLT